MYDKEKYFMALICHKLDNCSDIPLMVILSNHNGILQTEEVISGLSGVRELMEYDNYRFNGIPHYQITISQQEYDRWIFQAMSQR